MLSKKLKASSDKVDAVWSLRSMVSRLKKQKKSDLDDFVVFGIDFGTTYSGAAWATVADFESGQINLITSWPGTGREEAKAPTVLFYEHDEVMWGYGVPPDVEPIQWVKLLLLQDEDLPNEVRESEVLLRARKMLRETGKTATDVIGDYLRLLWQHILDTAIKARGKNVLNALSFHVVITVPAIWKNYAREGMRDAARKAGILAPRRAGPTTLSFAPEPEAAAIASLCEAGRVVSVDDVYVICDAGGGTVDLISYRVGGLDPIELHEAVVGTGGLCGGIFIDQVFESMCKNRLGRLWSRLSQAGIKKMMKDEWEYAVKPQFKLGNSKDEYIVAIPAEAFKGASPDSMDDDTRLPVIRNGRIHFPSSDIEKTFTQSFSEIEDLVDQQVRKAKDSKLAVAGIILVGGLGSSPYLHEYLEAKYRRKKIPVLQSSGTGPRTAICRGAIFKGFMDRPSSTPAESGGKLALEVASPVSIVSTIARQSLGVDFGKRYDRNIHRKEDRYWNSHQEGWMVGGFMQWYLCKGQNVSRQEPVRHSFYYTFESEEEYLGHETETIFVCFEDEAPERKDKSVRKFCVVSYDPDIPFDCLEDYRSKSGKVTKKFNFEIEMVPSGASVEFAIYHDGMKLGSQNATIEYQ